MCRASLKNCYLVLCMWGGVPLPWVTKPCGPFDPKADNTLGWALPSKKCLFMGEDLFQACNQFFYFGVKGPAQFYSLQSCVVVVLAFSQGL